MRSNPSQLVLDLEFELTQARFADFILVSLERAIIVPVQIVSKRRANGVMTCGNRRTPVEHAIFSGSDDRFVWPFGIGLGGRVWGLTLKVFFHILLVIGPSENPGREHPILTCDYLPFYVQNFRRKINRSTIVTGRH